MSDSTKAAATSEWWGVWCERDGAPGFWRTTDDGADFQTTRTEAERTAVALNEFAADRTDSLGWRYEARRYAGGIP